MSLLKKTINIISLYFTVNTLFFDNSTMHNIYETATINNNILYQLPKIIYFIEISSVISLIIKKLYLSEKEILKLK